MARAELGLAFLWLESQLSQLTGQNFDNLQTDPHHWCLQINRDGSICKKGTCEFESFPVMQTHSSRLRWSSKIPSLTLKVWEPNEASLLASERWRVPLWCWQEQTGSCCRPRTPAGLMWAAFFTSTHPHKILQQWMSLNVSCKVHWFYLNLT